MSAFLYGVFTGFSLLLAIGAQNAFVLKQGLKRHSVILVCFICAASDSLLIYLGVSGFSVIVEKLPLVEIYARYIGAGFLFVYGAYSFYAAIFQHRRLIEAESKHASTRKIILLCLAFTWLNPHVYLDTVILIGSISTKFNDQIHFFTLGAISSSWLFFFVLGYSAHFLSPILNTPKAWKILDLIVAIIMWLIALSLLI